MDFGRYPNKQVYDLIMAFSKRTNLRILVETWFWEDGMKNRKRNPAAVPNPTMRLIKGAGKIPNILSGDCPGYRGWHYDGSHRYPIEKDPKYFEYRRNTYDERKHPDKGLYISQFNGNNGFDSYTDDIRFEVYICEKTEVNEHRIYRPATKIYEWRQNGDTRGVEFDILDEIAYYEWVEPECSRR